MDKQEKKEKSEGLISEATLMRSENEEAEGNEDLSLKTPEKAIIQACSNVIEEEETEILTNIKVVSDGIDKGFESFCSDMFPFQKLKERKKENVDTTKAMDIGDCAAEKKPVEISDNAVLRRLLRGPRYFDTPGKSWGTCYNCGEEGHTAVNCTSARRKKPCFVCGSFEHNAKHCAKGKACFICKKGGHRANDCPERSHGGSQSSKICLKCGDSGHDMFSCMNNYSADDLKEILCYICKSFGHLCCAKYPDNGPRKFSCFRCGLLGHTGLACTASRGETSGTGSLNPCYRCGEEGHFARECTNSRVNKRNRELSTPKKKVPKKSKEQKEIRSVPRDFGRALKKKGKNEGGYTSGYKVKRRGGWIPDDPEDYPQSNNWRSPSTPRNKRAKISKSCSDGHASVSRSSGKSNRLDFDNSASYGSGNHQHHRFSTSGNFEHSTSYGSGNHQLHRFSTAGNFEHSTSYGYQHHRFSTSGNFEHSTSYGSGKYQHFHRSSASRFGNSSHDRWRRNNDW